MQVFVLGMHRSGTSALARVLNLTGLYFGGENVSNRYNDENPKGFWERRDVRTLNDTILLNANCDWDCVSAFDLRSVSTEAMTAYQSSAADIVFNMDAHRPWFIKEPRLSILFPVWRDVLETPVCVHIHRNPLEVAHSLNARNGIPINVGIALWEIYTIRALEASAELPRVLVSYEDMMRNPMPTISFIHDALVEYTSYRLRLPNESEVGRFLENGLYHHRKSVESFWSVATAEQRALYDLLRNATDAAAIVAPEFSSTGLATLRTYEESKVDIALRRERANARQRAQSAPNLEIQLALKALELKYALSKEREVSTQNRQLQGEVVQLRQKEGTVRTELALSGQVASHLERERAELVDDNARLKRESADLERKRAELADSNARLEREKADLERERADLERERAELADGNARLKRESADWKRKRAELADDNARLERERTDLERERAELADDNARLKRESADWERKRAELADSNARLEREKADLERERTDLERERAELADDNARLKRESADWKRKRAELADDNARLEREKADLERERTDLERERAELADDNARLEREREELASDSARLERERAELAGDNARLERERAGLEGERDELTQNNARLERQWKALELRSADAREEAAKRHREFADTVKIWDMELARKKVKVAELKEFAANVAGEIDSLLRSSRWRLGDAVLSSRYLLRRRPPSARDLLSRVQMQHQAKRQMLHAMAVSVESMAQDASRYILSPPAAGVQTSPNRDTELVRMLSDRVSALARRASEIEELHEFIDAINDIGAMLITSRRWRLGHFLLSSSRWMFGQERPLTAANSLSRLIEERRLDNDPGAEVSMPVQVVDPEKRHGIDLQCQRKWRKPKTSISSCVSTMRWTMWNDVLRPFLLGARSTFVSSLLTMDLTRKLPLGYGRSRAKSKRLWS